MAPAGLIPAPVRDLLIRIREPGDARLAGDGK